MRPTTAILAAAVLSLLGTTLTASTAHADTPTTPAAHRIATTDWSAGAVARGTGYTTPGGSRRVRELQRRLARAGYRPGPVDGLFGPRTERAVLRFQQRHQLRADAIAGTRTLHTLRTLHRNARHTTTPAAQQPTRSPIPLPTASTAPQPDPGPHPAADDRAGLPTGALLIALALLGIAAGTASYRRTYRTALQVRAPHSTRTREPIG